MTRDEIEALLPFLANDTLDGAERDEVAAAVAADPDLQRQLDTLRAIRASMQADEDLRSPGDFGHARLMRALEAETPVQAPQTNVIRPRIWQIAAAVLLAAVIGQAVLLSRPAQGPGFELAGEAAFTIAIRETATELEFRTLLLDAGVEIVAGPSSLGFYELRPLDGVTEAEARAVLQASDLVEDLSDAGE